MTGPEISPKPIHMKVCRSLVLVIFSITFVSCQGPHSGGNQISLARVYTAKPVYKIDPVTGLPIKPTSNPSTP
jgi:hypothetical protein